MAEKVELCLFDDEGNEERVPLPEMDGYVWHAFLPGIHPGQKYDARVHGPYDPAQGLRCNPNKLLLDPYAKAVDGQIDWHPSVFGYDFKTKKRNDQDSAAHMPKSVVVNPYFDWGVDRPPRTPYHKTVIYEAHVKGLTMTNPRIPEELRGTYAGVAHPATIEYLQDLGITAIELMPVHQFVQDDTLQQKGLRNYWGYNTIGFFAPQRVRQQHHRRAARAGVQGHGPRPARGGHRGHPRRGLQPHRRGQPPRPTLSFKGIDNRTYYRLVEDDKQHYMDYTGTGNLNVRTPQSLQLIMDSLRYWVTEMHVDGFRFDLASTLARELHAVDRLAAFFDLVHQDPVVSQVKLIAEPWDVGEGGYQVGNFPALWTEWNGKYRDTVRDFWRGEDATIGEFASRITGSSDLYQHSGRRPFASINFVTAHDGFTLNDLVSYNEKHNDANGEGNNDGESHNRSWNSGVEGRDRRPRDPAAAGPAATQLHHHADAQPGRADAAARRRAGADPERQQQRLLPGLRLTWIDWENIDEGLLEFTKKVTKLRTDHPTFRRRRFFHGRPIRRGQGDPVPDIDWLTPSGEQMTDEDWDAGYAKSLAFYLNGHGIRARTSAARRWWTTTSTWRSTPRTSRSTSACPATTTPRAGRRCSTRPRWTRSSRSRSSPAAP